MQRRMPNRVSVADELARRWTVKQVMGPANVKEGDTGVKARVGFLQ